jgi:N-acetylglutamate synthase-like GNAT family acetyltransferase
MKILKAKLSDMQRIAELSHEYGRYEKRLDKKQKIEPIKEEKETATKFFKKNEVIWFLLEEDKKVIGFVSVSIDKRGKTKIGVFHTIFIEEKYRGNSEGTKLLNFAFNYLKNKGITAYIVRTM